MNNSFFSEKELREIGFKTIGKNCFISRKASIYGADKIEIGDNVRIDDFCILSGYIVIGNYIHIAPYSAIYGGEKGVMISDFANISSRVCIYSISDDYLGEGLTNPMIPDSFKKVESKAVYVGKHVIIGSGSTVLPGVELKQGTAVGSMSLVKNSSEEWTIVAGIPAKMIKKRRKDKIIELEKQFLSKENYI